VHGEQGCTCSLFCKSANYDSVNDIADQALKHIASSNVPSSTGDIVEAAQEAMRQRKFKRDAEFKRDVVQIAELAAAQMRRAAEARAKEKKK